jgi:hypothetical protein
MVKPEKIKKMHMTSFILNSPGQILLAKNIRAEQRKEEARR